MPSFGYPHIQFSPPNEQRTGEKYIHIEKDRRSDNIYTIRKHHLLTGEDKSPGWDHLTKAIVFSAHKGKVLNIAKSMESHENHGRLMEEVMATFASGNKLSKKDLKYRLVHNYINRLTCKEDTK